MKLLLCSDLHADIAAAESIRERAADYDLLIGAGDFGNQRRQLERCLSALFPVPCPAVLVPGNNESFNELAAACRRWPNVQVLHGSGTEVQGVPIFGLGGGVPETPFGDWSFDLSEADAAGLLLECPEQAILISHSPPWELVDQPSQGGHLGSRAVRRCLELRQPRLVVCGHIHASAGQTAYWKTTPVINAGRAGLEWTL